MSTDGGRNSSEDQTREGIVSKHTTTCKYCAETIAGPYEDGDYMSADTSRTCHDEPYGQFHEPVDAN